MKDSIYTKFNRTRNKEKSLLCLKGILQGLTADKLLNEHELFFLDVWLRDQTTMNKDGDYIDLIEQVTDILEDKIVTQEEMRDMTEMVDDIMTYRDFWGNSFEGKVNELLGFLKGISADGYINETETRKLKAWLDNNKQHLDSWPFSSVSERLVKILEDDVVTEEESQELLNFAQELTGLDFMNSGVACGCSIEYFSDHPEELDISTSTICFTGTFAGGKRAEVEEDAREKGAIVSPRVTQKISVVVVGALASRDWIYSSYGRKIEQALQLKQDGHNILLISENTYRQFV